MIAEITALVGILSTLSALWISLSDHRQRVAEAHDAARERDRAENERRISERDAERQRAEEAAKEAEQQRRQAATDAERKRERAQAERMWQLNKLVIRLRSAAPGANAAPASGGWSLFVRNPSELPILDVQGFWRGSPLANPVDVQGSTQIEIPGPTTGETPRLADLSVHLSDARRHRWRQDLDGRVWSGAPARDGTGYAWTPAAMRWGPSWDVAAEAAEAVCPYGHSSQTTDYCDICGAVMTGRRPAPQLPSPAPYAAPAVAGQADCPVCATPRTSRYCEACGYDWEVPSPYPSAPPDVDYLLQGAAGPELPPPTPGPERTASAPPPSDAVPRQPAPRQPAPQRPAQQEPAQPAATPAPEPEPATTPYGSAPYGGPAPASLPPVMPAPALRVEASPERRPRLRPVLLFLWLLSAACFVLLLVVK